MDRGVRIIYEHRISCSDCRGPDTRITTWTLFGGHSRTRDRHDPTGGRCLEQRDKSLLQGLMDPQWIIQAVFDPLPFNVCLTQYYVGQLLAIHYQDRFWVYCKWQCIWDARRVFDRLTFWFLPPELVRQVLTFVLECWAERPLTTSGLFFIPWTVLAFWRGISRHLVELPTLFPRETMPPFPPIISPPLTFLPCSVCVLQSRSVYGA